MGRSSELVDQVCLRKKLLRRGLRVVAMTQLLDPLFLELGRLPLRRVAKVALHPTEVSLLASTAPFLQESGPAAAVASFVVLLQLGVFSCDSPWKHVCNGGRFEFKSLGVVERVQLSVLAKGLFAQSRNAVSQKLL